MTIRIDYLFIWPGTLTFIKQDSTYQSSTLLILNLVSLDVRHGIENWTYDVIEGYDFCTSLLTDLQGMNYSLLVRDSINT